MAADQVDIDRKTGVPFSGGGSPFSGGGSPSRLSQLHLPTRARFHSRGPHHVRSLEEVTGLSDVYTTLHRDFSLLLINSISRRWIPTSVNFRGLGLRVADDVDRSISEKMPPADVSVDGSNAVTDNSTADFAGPSSAVPVLTTRAEEVGETVHASVASVIRDSLAQGDITAEEYEHIMSVHHISASDEVVPTLHLRDIFRGLGKERFSVLIDSIVQGNQCIAQGPYPQSTRDLLSALVQVVPYQCALVEHDSEVYLDVFRASFLGLRPGVELPVRMVELTAILVTVEPVHRSGKGWVGWKIALTWPASPQSEVTMDTAQRTSFSIQLCDYLSSPCSIDSDTRWIALLKRRWIRRATIFLTLSMSSAVVSLESIEILLTKLQLGESDVPVLRFFTGALKGPPRRRLLRLIAAARKTF